MLAGCVLASACPAEVSAPEALISASGLVTSASYDSFSALGDNFAGVIYDNDYTTAVGLAALIFTPLSSQSGQPVPVVTTPEGEVIAYPNPFNPDLPESVTIAYKMTQDVTVKTYVFDLTGQVIRVIVSSSANRGADGFSRVSWDGRSGFGEVVPNGIYFVRVVQGSSVVAKAKIMVLK